LKNNTPGLSRIKRQPFLLARVSAALYRRFLTVKQIDLDSRSPIGYIAEEMVLPEDGNDSGKTFSDTYPIKNYRGSCPPFIVAGTSIHVFRGA
jgi:hypothetical protein